MTTDTPQDVVVGLTREGEFRCHAAGCRDIKRESYQNRWTHRGATSLSEVAEDANSDFIAEGSMTEEQALEYTSFAPCVTLPV